MNSDCKSSSTTLELKYILEKNFYHDAFYALLCFASITILEPFGSFCCRIGTTALCISLSAMVVNLIFAMAIEFGHGKIIRDLCTTKAVHYFLMLHRLTSFRVRPILRQIKLGEDLRFNINKSISFRTAGELELMEIVTDNVLFGFGYSFMWLMLVPITRSNYFDEQFGVKCGIICARISYCIAFSVAPDGLLALAIKLGHGDLTHEWCRTKAVLCYLMLHYHTRERARLVLQKLERERQEFLDWLENAKMQDEQLGEVVPFEKCIYDGNFFFSFFWSEICHGNCCSICSREYKMSEKVRIVRKCNHRFHADCFLRLLCKGGRKCPTCNVDLR